MLAQQIVNGFTLGSTYALIAIGYTLVLGVLKKLNLAHGELFMAGAFTGIGAASLGAPLLVSLLAGFVAAGLIAVAIERTCFYPLRHANFLSPMLSTIAFGLFLQGLATQIFGSDPSRFPVSGASFQIQFATLSISAIHIVILATAFGLMIGIDLLVNRTRWGIAVRAASDDAETAAQQGMSVSALTMTTFLVSGALAGAAGVLTTLVYSQVNPFIGIRQGLIGMVAMVIGGLGNLRGAMIGGLAIGLIETMNDAYFTAGYRDFVIFFIFFVFLVFRPQGLFPVRQER